MSKPSALQPDAIQLLTEDHKKVKKLFRAYQALMEDDADDDEKQELAAEICVELTIHVQIEEEIFYPAVREQLEDDDLMDEAVVEHMTAKDLIAQIEDMRAGDELFDAKVTVLGEYIDHHVKEEQNEMFPEARKVVDVEALGIALMERKQELMRDAGDSGTRAPAADRSPIARDRH